MVNGEVIKEMQNKRINTIESVWRQTNHIFLILVFFFSLFYFSHIHSILPNTSVLCRSSFMLLNIGGNMLHQIEWNMAENGSFLRCSCVYLSQDDKSKAINEFYTTRITNNLAIVCQCISGSFYEIKPIYLWTFVFFFFLNHTQWKWNNVFWESNTAAKKNITFKQLFRRYSKYARKNLQINTKHAASAYRCDRAFYSWWEKQNRKQTRVILVSNAEKLSPDQIYNFDETHKKTNCGLHENSCRVGSRNNRQEKPIYMRIFSIKM